jgi:hypothetical protein
LDQPDGVGSVIRPNDAVIRALIKWPAFEDDVFAEDVLV